MPGLARQPGRAVARVNLLQLSAHAAVNKTGGRDHWPSAGYALVAGGGLKRGQYVRETDTYATRTKSRPYTPQNLFATLYHVLDMNPAATIPDGAGRPMYLLDDREPIRELL